jgi:Skp family chaperone for outer membrane proteins
MMKKLLIGSAALLASAAAIAQVAPATSSAAAPAAKVHTRAEVQSKIAQHFAKLDTNRDGSLTKAEADAARQAMRAQRGERKAERREDRRENAFERFDSNRDGAISRAEWDAASAQRAQRMASRDRDGDGRPDSRKQGRGGMGALGGHMFQVADGNSDGRVTLQEAQAAALRHFDMADVNRDGQITPDERKQMRQRMRAERRG